MKIIYSTICSENASSLTPLAKKLLENGLYKEGRVFKKWWADPEYYFQNGAIISYASIGDKIIGVGILNFFFYAYSSASDVMGLSGYYVKKEYRGSGIATQLTKNLNDCYKESFGMTKKVTLACHSGFTLTSAYSTSFGTRHV